jgi:large subunit ribosomal protein L21
MLEIPLHAFLKPGIFSQNFLIISMFAIVSIAGQQFKVEEGQQIFVHRLAAQEGDSVSFDAVHLIENDGRVTIGVPNIGGASIKASVLSHVKGDKVIVFHKKRRKGYRKKNGHRQSFTKIKIESIQA